MQVWELDGPRQVHTEGSWSCNHEFIMEPTGITARWYNFSSQCLAVQVPIHRIQVDGLPISSSTQGQECSVKECQLAEVWEVDQSEVEKRGTLTCLDLESLSLTPLSKGGRGTEVPKPEFINEEPQKLFPCSETLPPSWCGYDRENA